MERVTEVVATMVREALERAEQLTDRPVPLVLAVHDHCVRAASAYVEVHDDPERVVRPSHSIGLEPSRLLQRLQRAGWHGPAHVLATPGRALGQALDWAGATTGAGVHDAAVVCSVRRDLKTGHDEVMAVLFAGGEERGERRQATAAAPVEAP